ncbi:hypothetical protein BBP40_004628 [Aspergillus hancockii]|nr:hypothetical protein BBP40_004628 [Aspergillus hancockii]
MEGGATVPKSLTEDQILQDVSNQRTGGWGGSIEKRARFEIEVAKAIVDAVGMKMADPVPKFQFLVRQLRGLGLAYLHVIESRVANNVDCEMGEEISPILDAWGTGAPVLVAGGV